MIKACFNSKHCKLTIILYYAPTNDSDKEDKEDWYEQLQQAVPKVQQHDMLLIIGDMNAKVNADNSNCERAMGKHGCSVVNDNGELLVDFCLNNNCVIGVPSLHTETSTSSHRNHLMVKVKKSHQIDSIIINGKWRRFLQDVRVCRGADSYSDHLQKLHRAMPHSWCRKQLDVTCPVTKQEFILKLRNRFGESADTLWESDHETTNTWDTIKKTYVEVATKVLGHKKKNHKEWLTPRIWKKIKDRKQLKIKMLSTKSPRFQQQV